MGQLVTKVAANWLVGRTPGLGIGFDRIARQIAWLLARDIFSLERISQAHANHLSPPGLEGNIPR
jgi:hypothetical protein